MTVLEPEAAPSGPGLADIRSVRLVGDADAVGWVVRTLAQTGLGIEPVRDAESLAASEEERGPIVWVSRPLPDPDCGSRFRPDAAVLSIPCLVVIPHGGHVPDFIAGSPSVESFDFVREGADEDVLEARLERLLLLHRRRSQTEIVLQNLTDVVYTRALDGTVTSVNAAGERLAGRTRDQILGRSLGEFWGPPGAARREVEATNEALLRQGHLHGRIAVPATDGRLRTFEREVFLLRDGHGTPCGAQVILTDVTEELESKERLRREAKHNEILAAIAAAARDSVDLDHVLAVSLETLGIRVGARAALFYALDAATGIVTVTHQWSRDPGNPSLVGATVPLERTTFIRRIVETSGPGVIPDTSTLEPTGPAAAQMVRLGARSAAGIPALRHGELMGVLGMTWSEPRDFSEDELAFYTRLSDLLALSIHATRLYGDLQQKVRALDEAQRFRDQADRDRASLQAMLVHDLKNPLSAVMATLELMLEREQKVEEPRTVRILQNSLASAHGLQGLIEDALLVYRPDDAPVPEKVPAAPADVLSLTLEEARWLCRARNVSLGADLPANLPIVRLDAPRFRRAVANLLANAVKFTPRGGSVTARALVEQHDGRRELVVQVVDTGPGLSAEAIAKLTTPYYRAAGALGVPGTGLGLAVVKRVALEHGGRLEIESDGRSGSTFTLRVPA